MIVCIQKEGVYKFGNRTLEIRKFDENIDNCNEFPSSDENKALADISGVRFPLVLRTRRDGDIISPFGMNGTMKFKKYLNSKGIARHLRDDLLLLCKDNEVFWAIGAGISSKIGVKNKPTHVLEIK